MMETDIIIYDSNNRPLDNLTQWDQNISLVIHIYGIVGSIDSPTVHFFNRQSEDAYVVVPDSISQTTDTMDLTVQVPNELLQSDQTLILCIHSESQSQELKTVGIVSLSVIPRKKPQGYIYESNVPYIISQLDLKANKANTVLDTTLSMGRKADTNVGNHSIALGEIVEASGAASAAIGSRCKATAYGSAAIGSYCEATGENAVAAGYHNLASGVYSFAENARNDATGTASHAEGLWTKAAGACQHVQGKYNVEDAAGTYAHIVGNGSDADHRANAHTLDWNGNAWFAGDIGSRSISVDRHPTGSIGKSSIAVGRYTKASGIDSQAFGQESQAEAPASSAFGEGCSASSAAQLVQGKYNIIDDNGAYAHIVGNGTGVNNRSNAYTLDWDGNAWFAGGIVLDDTSVQGARYIISVSNGALVLTPVQQQS